MGSGPGESMTNSSRVLYVKLSEAGQHRMHLGTCISCHESSSAGCLRRRTASRLTSNSRVSISGTQICMHHLFRHMSCSYARGSAKGACIASTAPPMVDSIVAYHAAPCFGHGTRWAGGSRTTPCSRATQSTSWARSRSGSTCMPSGRSTSAGPWCSPAPAWAVPSPLTLPWHTLRWGQQRASCSSPALCIG